MTKDFSIKAVNLSKKYVLYHEKPTLVENIFQPRKKETIWALKNLDFEIKKGEKIGIIGDNGSGKSTLLKIITGITEPTFGQIQTTGKIAALVSLDSGFHPELTGEENIYLNAMLLGMAKKEIKKKLDKIIDFSGLKKEIDLPLFTYSSGMKLRLGFSVAIFSDPDILLIDEILSAGDQAFQKKSYQVIQKLFKEKKTIVFVSHHLPNVSDLCSECFWLEKGAIVQKGKTDKIIQNYINKKKSG